MTCPHCFLPLSERKDFCPNCGARLAEPDVQTLSEATEDPTYGPLAYANLMRLRGDWEGARERTVTVMREYPNSGTAHSLMGDIYADQQMYEDAAQWYRMALELEPSNVADARKLAEAEKRLRGESALPEAEAETPSRFSPYRVLAVVGVAFLVIAISLGFYVKTHTVPLVDLGPSWTRPPRSITEPNPGSQAPGPLPPADRTAPGGTVVSEVHTVREKALGAVLTEPSGLSVTGLRVSNIEIDPRDGAAVVTADGTLVDAAAPGWMAALVSDALAVGQRALKADTALASVSVRVVMPISSDKGPVDEVTFIGDLAPVAQPGGGREVPGTFTRRWWRPGLMPPAAIGNTPS